MTIVALVAGTKSYAGEVNFFTQIGQKNMEPLIQSFSDETGIQVNFVDKPKGRSVLDQIRDEKEASNVDVVHFSGLGLMLRMAVMGLSQPVDSTAMKENLPARVIDDDLLWFGLTQRVRIVAASKDRTTQSEFSRYEDLGKPPLKNRLCTRSMTHGYSITLTSSMMVNRGNKRTTTWLAGIKENLARPPEGNDRSQVQAVYEGKCDFAVLNHYYVKRMLEDPEQKKWLDSVYLVFPNQSEKDRGAMTSISGVSLSKYSPNSENGIRLMEYLSRPENQSSIADATGEYPVSPGARIPAYLEQYGEVKFDDSPIYKLANRRQGAMILTQRQEFPEGD